MLLGSINAQFQHLTEDVHQFNPWITACLC